VLAGRPDLPAATAAELVQLSRQQPGRLTVGTDGVGTSLHLTAEMLQQQAGLSWTHVPYKSGPQALTELAGGQIDLAVLPVALVQSFVREGKLRGLGVTSRQRAATLPQTPSLSDTAVWQAFDVEAWQGLLLPARTDARIAERLARETAAVLAEPELVRKLAEAGFKPMVMEQAQFTAHLQRERKLLEATVQAARLQGTG
jgi:tripartite-type tricarboxylate transporter receptor subunit TctC